MEKAHIKNGFHYKHKRSYYCGVWSYTWSIKPIEYDIFIVYTNPESFKTLKVDVERLLSNPSEAREYYLCSLKLKSDVESARQELSDADAHYERVQSPDFDIKGNNPNAESRVRRNAASRLSSARDGLEQALRYKAMLDGTSLLESECKNCK